MNKWSQINEASCCQCLENKARTLGMKKTGIKKAISGIYLVSKVTVTFFTFKVTDWQRKRTNINL